MRRTAARMSGKSSPSVIAGSVMRRSRPREARLALLVEGADALAAVRGRDEAVIGLDLEQEPAAEVELQSGMDRLLRLAHREGRVVGDRGGGGERLVHQRLALDQAIDQTPVARVFGRKR